MKLVSLSTENFKRIGTRTFKFTDGVNFIVGENGAGKSTLLRAIAVALFGPTMLPGTSGDIATWGAKSWNVGVVFENAGVTYEVQRGSNSAWVKIDGALQANGQTALTKFMEDLLNITAKDYNLLIHSRQGETNYVITYGATALQRKVEEFAGIAELDSIVTAAGGISRQRASEQEWVKSLLWDADKLQANQEARNLAKAELAAAQEQLLELEAVKAPVEPPKPTSDLPTERAKLRKFLSYSDDQRVYLRTKADLEAAIAELPAATPVPSSDALVLESKDLKEKLKALREDTAEVEEAKRKILQHHNSLNEILDGKEFDEAMSEFTATGKDLAAKSEAAADGLAVLAEKVTTASAAAVQALSKVNHLRVHVESGRCEACGTKLMADLDALQAQLAEAELEATQAAEARTTIEAAAKTAKLEADEIDGLISSLMTKMSQAQWHKNQKEQVDVPKVRISLSEDELQQQIYKVAAQKESLDKLQEQADALESKRARLNKQLGNLAAPEVVEPTSEEVVAQIEAAHEVWSSLYMEWSAATAKQKHALEMCARTVAEHARDVARFDADFAQQADYKVQAEEKAASADVADRLVKYLRTRRATYLSEVWTSITSVASNFLNTSTRGWMTEVEINDGKFMFKQDNVWVSAVEASGAQAAFLGAALRVGLNKALYKGNTFVAFDEPTEAMKEENARNLVTGVSGVAKQVLLISHRDTDQSLASNIIEV